MMQGEDKPSLNYLVAGFWNIKRKKHRSPKIQPQLLVEETKRPKTLSLIVQNGPQPTR